MNPDLYVFDIGNVLLGFDPNRVARNLDRIEPGKGPAVVRDIWDGPWMNRLETGKIGGPELFDHVRRRHGLRLTQASFLRAFCDIFRPLKALIIIFLLNKNGMIFGQGHCMVRLIMKSSCAD